MTDRQAKNLAVEATWSMVIMDLEFPHPHGSYSNLDVFEEIARRLDDHYHENAARRFAEALIQAQFRAQRRKAMMLSAIILLSMAAGTVLIFWLNYRR